MTIKVLTIDEEIDEIVDEVMERIYENVEDLEMVRNELVYLANAAIMIEYDNGLPGCPVEADGHRVEDDDV